MQSHLTSTEITIILSAFVLVPTKHFHYVLLLAVVLFCSCSRRTVELEKLSSSSSLKLNSDSSSRIKVNTEVRTRAITWIDQNRKYQVTIVPDGEFTFDPKSGFKGRAKDITITGTDQLKQSSQSDQRMRKDSAAAVKATKSLNASRSASSKQKSTVATAPVLSWLALLFLIPIGLFLYRKFLKPRAHEND